MIASVAQSFERPRSNARVWTAACMALAMAGVAATAQAADAAPQTAAEKAAAAIPVLNRAQIDALLAKPDKTVVLDVRRAEELSDIGGFPVFLSIQNGDLEKNLAFIPRDRQILTVSNHAHRAQSAGAVLTAKGYKVVGAAGVLDYEAEGGKLAGKKSAAPATAAAPAKPGA